jgi:superfamily I DNA/RNA helicase
VWLRRWWQRQYIAGSGKTRTLTSKVVFLLSNPQLNLEPQNVVVATFTVKAASEMEERLSKLVGGTVGRCLLLGTFHSIARRYLLKYGHLIGLKSGWGNADSSNSKAICKAYFESFFFNRKQNQILVVNLHEFFRLFLENYQAQLLV